MAKLASVVVLVVLFGSTLIQSSPQEQKRTRQLRRRIQPQPQPILVEELEKPKVYEIRREISPNIGDGSFRYYSAMSNGLESQQQGHFENPLQSQVHQGSYTTMDEHGQVVRIDYVADKNGFRPLNEYGIPSGPSPPPIPHDLAKATSDILAQQKSIRDQHLMYLRAGYIAHG